MTSITSPLVEEAQQVLAVGGLLQRRRERLQLRRVDPAEVVGDLLGAGHLQPLARLQRLDERARLQERFVRPGVQPGDAAPQLLEEKVPLLEVEAIEIRDLQL